MPKAEVYYTSSWLISSLWGTKYSKISFQGSSTCPATWDREFIRKLAENKEFKVLKTHHLSPPLMFIAFFGLCYFAGIRGQGEGVVLSPAPQGATDPCWGPEEHQVTAPQCGCSVPEPPPYSTWQDQRLHLLGWRLLGIQPVTSQVGVPFLGEEGLGGGRARALLQHCRLNDHK